MLHRNALLSAILLITLSASLYSAYLYRNNLYRTSAWTAPLTTETRDADVEVTKQAPPAIPKGRDKNDEGKDREEGAGSKKESVGAGSKKGADKKTAADWIEGLNLTFPLNYACRTIEAHPEPGLKRASLTKDAEPLFGAQHRLNSIKDYRAGGEKLACPAPFSLAVPAPRISSHPFNAAHPLAVNASHMSFGIQTTLRRLEATVPHLERWIAYTGAQLLVILIESEKGDKTVQANKEKMGVLEKKMRGLGIEAMLIPPVREKDTFPQRYFSLVDELYNRKKQGVTKWISLIDDDTFFPSMTNLLHMLDRFEEPLEEQHYVGSLSEDWWAVSHYGYMAFGGAGMFLSVALAEAMHPHAQQCKDPLRTSAGDISVMDCIYAHTDTKLTSIADLHQADMHGDLSGFYESGRKHLSLHHWKDGSLFGKGLPMHKMHLAADVCTSGGGDCFLQRWQFGSDTVLTNGYSIAVYPNGHLGHGADGVEPDEKRTPLLEKMEGTWNRNMKAEHSLGPARDPLELEKDKVQYLFVDAMPFGGGVKQLYLHKGKAEGDLDTLLEVTWLKGKGDFGEGKKGVEPAQEQKKVEKVDASEKSKNADKKTGR
ncbi:hypothetical protein MMC25_003848 [Agyrium rufum]|nr:hypothetical protein [Agyrium rufum]